VTIHWSKDSKKFALEREDNRKVGDYWVIHSLANPRRFLEARSYPLPGEANILPVSEIDIFEIASKQRAVVQPKNFVDEVLTISDAPQYGSATVKNCARSRKRTAESDAAIAR